MRNKILFVIVALFLAAAGYLVYTPHELIAPKIPQLASLSKQMGPWRSVHDTTFDEATIKVLRPTDYLMRTYVNAQNTPITLYVGYHDGSPSAGPIHSPKNCLPGGGWEFKSLEDIPLTYQDTKITVVRAVLTKDGNDTTFYYWYQVRGEIITADLDMKIAEFMGMIIADRKDAAFIRISVPTGNKEQEIELMQNFFQSVYPELKNHLPS